MCLRIYLNGDGTGRGSHLSLFFVVMRGLSDALLKWPFNQKVKELQTLRDIDMCKPWAVRLKLLSVTSWSVCFVAWLCACFSKRPSLFVYFRTGDLDAAGSEQQGAHHWCLSTWCHFLLLPETCEWDEHRQWMSSLLSALQARWQELLHPRRHHLHQSNRGPHRALSGPTRRYSLETRQLSDHYSFTLAQSWSV